MDFEFAPRVPAVYSYVYPSSSSSSSTPQSSASTPKKNINNYNNNNNNYNNNNYSDEEDEETSAEALLLQQIFGISPSHYNQYKQQLHQQQQTHQQPYQPKQQQQTKQQPSQSKQQQQQQTKPVVQLQPSQPKQQQQQQQQQQPTQVYTSSVKSPSSSFSPKIDILNGNDSYLIRVELAGVDKQDISIDIKKDQILTISGEKKDPFKQQQSPQSIKITTPSNVEPLIQETSSLSLSSSKVQPITQNNNYKYYNQESSYGKFNRDVQLPSDIDITQITASHDNGILLITIPKQQDLTPQSFRINIQ